MSKIIFYGSTTGNTEMVAQEIQKLLGEELVAILLSNLNLLD